MINMLSTEDSTVGPSPNSRLSITYTMINTLSTEDSTVGTSPNSRLSITIGLCYDQYAIY